MLSQITLSLAVTPILAQSAAALAIDGWWIIVIFLILVVVISLLVLGNRQEPAIPPAAAHEHDHSAPHQAALDETEGVSAAEMPQVDDLAKIEGIGPKIAGLLSERGIKTFRQLANADVDELNRILDEARLAFADPSTWPEQSRLADLQEWEALSELQARLKGGR
jgi:predicted flap endonuclease-1-like 5' DNA nuclease